MCGTSPPSLSSHRSLPKRPDCTDAEFPWCPLLPLCPRLDQASESIQIPFVQRIRGNRAGRLAFALRRFQQHRQVAKPAVVDDPPKRLESEKAFADVLVTIHPAAERPLRVAQLTSLQPVEADGVTDRLE